MRSDRFHRWVLLAVCLSLIILCSCEDDTVRDTSSLLLPRFYRSEVFGFLAGLGTTFAGLPDLITMFKRKSSKGMNPRMAAILGIFQILWIYYGWLIVSRPVIAWNMIAVVTNFVTVGAYRHFLKIERLKQAVP